MSNPFSLFTPKKKEIPDSVIYFFVPFLDRYCRDTPSHSSQPSPIFAGVGFFTPHARSKRRREEKGSVPDFPGGDLVV